MVKRIISDNEWNDKYFPVKAFFNEISDNAFLKVIEYMSNGNGHGLNVAYCVFPDNVEPDEKPFEGVKFGVYEDEIILEFQEVYYYMKEASNAYIKNFPEDKETINKLLNTFCKKYNIKCD